MTRGPSFIVVAIAVCVALTTGVTTCTLVQRATDPHATFTWLGGNLSLALIVGGVCAAIVYVIALRILLREDARAPGPPPFRVQLGAPIAAASTDVGPPPSRWSLRPILFAFLIPTTITALVFGCVGGAFGAGLNPNEGERLGTGLVGFAAAAIYGLGFGAVLGLVVAALTALTMLVRRR